MHQLTKNECHARFCLVVYPDAVEKIVSMCGVKELRGHVNNQLRGLEEEIEGLCEMADGVLSRCSFDEE